MLKRILFGFALLLLASPAFAQDGVVNPQTDASKLTTGALAVARGGTNYTGGAWTAFTYTVTAGTGSITSQTAGGTYLQVGKWTCLSISTTLTNAGTGSGTLTVALPFAPARGVALVGRENGVSAKAIQLFFAGTTGAISNYDGTTPTIATNANYVVDGCYEAS